MTSANGSGPNSHSAGELQASGMVSVQAHCTCSEAMLLMEQRATDDGASLAAIADEVLGRRMRFGS